MKASSLLLAVPTCCWASSLHTVLSSATANAEQAIDCALDLDGSCQKKGTSGGKVPATTDDDTSAPPIPLQCGVYMAPSTLGEATNMGMYAGKEYGPNTVIQSEIAIPLLFREWGAHRRGFTDGELWDRYIWEGSVANLDPYTDTNREDSRAVFVPGIGCTINSIMDMMNIESTAGSVYDTAGLHRSRDPGAGAFAPYHSSNTTSSVDIPAGAELFASYGDYWIPFIDGAQITLEVNLAQAEEFLRDEYWPWIQARHGRLSDEFKEELWQLTSKNFPVYSKSFTVLPQVPWKQVEAFLEAHPAAQDHSAVKHFVRKQSVRTMDWLNTYGYCQDHLIPAKSTIPQAGRGAFANRDLPKGTVVGYSPLIHIGVHGRDLYWISYPADKDHAAAAAATATTDSTPETPTMPTKKKRHMYDLILNYSFGHANSTLLLTPYGGMVNYINHPPKGVTPNVAIRWPNKELVAHKPWWHDRTPEQLRDTVEKIGLSFEYVALRDIAAGEEVFMDYGPEWEAAWEAHVKSWYPPPESLHYMSRSEWPEKYIRTIDEAEYPDNLVTLCIESYTTSDDDTSYWLPVLVETPHRVYCRALERFESERTSDDEDDNDNNIAKKGTATYTYTVELDVTVGSESTKIVVHDVPEEGIFLLDRAYSQDWHLPQAFRHEIMLPDHLMPPAWHNGPAVPPQSDDDSRTQHPLDSNDEDDDDMDSDDE